MSSGSRPTCSSSARDLLPTIATRMPVTTQGHAHGAADRAARIERGVRVLEDELDAPTHRPRRPNRRRRMSGSSSSSTLPRSGRSRPTATSREGGLAATRFTHQAHDLAASRRRGRHRRRRGRSVHRTWKTPMHARSAARSRPGLPSPPARDLPSREGRESAARCAAALDDEGAARREGTADATGGGHATGQLRKARDAGRGLAGREGQ